MRTLAQLRNNVARLAGRRFFEGTAESAGSSSLDAEDSEAWPNDYFVNLWIVDDRGRYGRITDFRPGEFTFRASESLRAGEYVVMSPHPNEITSAINDAGRYLFNTVGVGRRIVDDSLVIGSPLFNSNFFSWPGDNPDGWTTTGEKRFRGVNTLNSAHSVELTNNETLEVSPRYQPLLAQAVGHNVEVRAIVKTNSAVALNVDFGGATESITTAGAGWHVLRYTLTPAGSTLRFTAKGSLYIDRVWLEDVPNVYFIPVSQGDTPSNVVIVPILDEVSPEFQVYGAPRPYSGLRIVRQDDLGGAMYNVAQFSTSAPKGWVVRMEATVPVTGVSSVNDIVELEEAEAQLLEVEAAIRIIDRNISLQPVVVQSDYHDRRAKLLLDREVLIRSLRRPSVARLLPDVR